MAINNYQWHTTRSRTGLQRSVHQLNATRTAAVCGSDSVELLSKKIDPLSPPIQSTFSGMSFMVACITVATIYREVNLDNKDGNSKVMELEKVEGKKKSSLTEYQSLIPYLARYAKFLREILSNKRKLEDLAIVTLNEECSAILKNKLPEKKYDPRSFIVPCMIGDLTISNALASLGASINLMSYILFTKLGLGETKPTRMSIHLADKTIKYPRGIVEDLLVKVDKLIFPLTL
ncbi:uncharacterized protein LOC125370010 [Ricinus communis]|uniref:uncharacterized protein LOC125370010 n=1 Tax=Ricinus communis TaxID=3988 RepID=UPI00201A3D59|nr:uncharacterized protein LOC125370010 [Ricinus communis]